MMYSQRSGHYYFQIQWGPSGSGSQEQCGCGRQVDLVINVGALPEGHQTQLLMWMLAARQFPCAMIEYHAQVRCIHSEQLVTLGNLLQSPQMKIPPPYLCGIRTLSHSARVTQLVPF